MPSTCSTLLQLTISGGDVVSELDAPEHGAKWAWDLATSGLGALVLAYCASLVWHCADDSYQLGQMPGRGYTTTILSSFAPFNQAVVCTQPLLPLASSPAGPYIFGIVAAGVIYALIWLGRRRTKRV